MAMETGYVAECFWPGVGEDDLRDLDRRLGTAAGQLSVRYVGSLLIHDDEVVLCLFEGPVAAVRAVTERAGLPYERILRSTRVPWARDT
jgi:hypothetical protein